MIFCAKKRDKDLHKTAWIKKRGRQADKQNNINRREQKKAREKQGKNKQTKDTTPEQQ